MPVFKAKIAIIKYVLIPVYAESEEAAMEYLKSSKDWHRDGEIDNYGSGDILHPESVERINGPLDTPEDEEYPWGSEMHCWNAKDMELSVPEAFHGPEYPTADELEDFALWDIQDTECELKRKKQNLAWDEALLERRRKSKERFAKFVPPKPQRD